MSEQRRFEKTIRRIQQGDLPTARRDTQHRIMAGAGMPCDGCGEPIARTETLYEVTMGSTLIFRFHEVCYSAWQPYDPDSMR